MKSFIQLWLSKISENTVRGKIYKQLPSLPKKKLSEIFNERILPEQMISTRLFGLARIKMCLFDEFDITQRPFVFDLASDESANHISKLICFWFLIPISQFIQMRH